MLQIVYQHNHLFITSGRKHFDLKKEKQNFLWFILIGFSDRKVSKPKISFSLKLRIGNGNRTVTEVYIFIKVALEKIVSELKNLYFVTKSN